MKKACDSKIPFTRIQKGIEISSNRKISVSTIRSFCIENELYKKRNRSKSVVYKPKEYDKIKNCFILYNDNDTYVIEVLDKAKREANKIFKQGGFSVCITGLKAIDSNTKEKVVVYYLVFFAKKEIYNNVKQEFLENYSNGCDIVEELI